MKGAAAKVTARPAGRVDAGRAEGGARKVLFSAMKNEAPFVLEWIAYHKVIGFDDVVICSNPSNDGTEELLAALSEVGEIRHLQATPQPDEGPQRVASEVFTREFGYRDGNWYLWLDADEFLNVHAGDRTLAALIREMGERQFAPISWRIFGSGGNDRFPGRFISPAFTGATLAGFPANLEQKTLFHFSDAVLGFARFGINRPAIAKRSPLTVADVMVGNGGTARADFRANQRWLGGGDFGKSAWVDPEEFGWRHAQINHYVIRTPEFFALKRLRGRGIRASSTGAANRRHTDAFFAEYDRNDAEDRSILHWQDAVTVEMTRLLAHPGVAAAAEASATKVAAILAELDPPVAAGPAVAAPPRARQVHGPDKGGAQSDAASSVERQTIAEAYAQAAAILEYGSGDSTLWAAQAGAHIISVESDRVWAERMATSLAGVSARAKIHWEDIGPTRDWGFPVDFGGRARFHRYALAVWDRPDFRDPDLVLIDGRFRAACLVAVLLRARRPTTVLFQDYADRRFYHGVERLARKDEMIGRLARFTVTPGAIPPDLITQAFGWFSDPR